ncbi:hypothetical protein ACFFQ5_07335 [Pseudomonas brassicacearum]|jgi:hypothetical protein|nr:MULTISPECIES: hypothetical protein [Pseudomonas]EIK70977.1 hypothetical protein PflQ8_1397 [Pseudomonas fluorescens Q8r1-96]KAB0520503.1 hypothetical protein F7R20_27595 [Pseudomonas brassicacearum subsp. brassicacearum]MCM2460684.1 hypothetical protein [Pseudomonas sp. CG7]NJP63522.1 hypothetical protein [Pseudomonas brassicacearum]PJH86635.1 hypothetical protein CVG87_23660 [Pseudomonas sp. WCS365]
MMFCSNGDNSFRAYLNAGTENLDEILSAGSPFLTMMDDLDSYLTQHVSGPAVAPDELVVHSILINSRFLLMTAFRVGLTGHAAGVYPILRTALETACYALLMTEDESQTLTKIWMSRNDSPDDLKTCKKAFQAPIKAAQKIANKRGPGLGDWMYKLYESSIDFGAHPNAKTVTLHTRMYDDEAGLTQFENVGLYAVGNHGYEWGLLACVEMGLATAIILSMTHPVALSESIQALQALNDQKNSLEVLIREKHSQSE